MVVVLIVLAIGAVIAIAVFSYLAEKKRREAIARWAATNGWSYTGEDDRWVDAWRGDPFDEGHSRKAVERAGARDRRSTSRRVRLLVQGHDEQREDDDHDDLRVLRSTPSSCPPRSPT